MLRFSVATRLALLLALLFIQPSRADQQEEQKVRQLAHTFLGMVRTEDPTPLDTIREILAEDFIQSTSHGTVVHGRKENLQWMEKAVAEIRELFQRFDYRFDIQSVRMYPNSGLIFGKITLFGDLKDGGEHLERQIWETMLFQKTNGQWKLVHEHSTRVKVQ